MSWKGLKPSAFAHVIEDEVKETRNKIATEALQMVVAGSPVDTGAFRGNHRVSINSADYSSDAGITDRGGEGTIDAGMAVIRSAAKPFQAIYIQNNMVYAERLEGGHSDQAPNGIYRPTFAHIRAKYSKS